MRFIEAYKTFVAVRPGAMFDCQKCNYTSFGGIPYECPNCGADFKNFKRN